MIKLTLLISFFFPFPLPPLLAENPSTLPLSQLIADQQGESQPTPTSSPEPPITPKQNGIDIHQATVSYETTFIKTLIVLVALLLLVILTVWMFKKISHGRMRSFNFHKTIKVIEKRPLSPKSMLYLVEVAGKQVLIAESQFEVRKITTIDWTAVDKDL
ncbi:MAG: flagellar biosynthetic protein FliO [Simkania negevensis]|nr:flagellar biosynthetic protein FliO [Simkania negevensis]